MGAEAIDDNVLEGGRRFHAVDAELAEEAERRRTEEVGGEFDGEAIDRAGAEERRQHRAPPFDEQSLDPGASKCTEGGRHARAVGGGGVGGDCEGACG